MAGTELSYAQAGGACPYTVALVQADELRVYSVTARWNGASAAASFHPALSVYSPAGVLVSRTRPEQVFAAGDSGVVTYAPFLHNKVVAAGGNGVPYMVRRTAVPLTAQIWVGGEGITPSSRGSGVASPMLSPDLTRFLYLGGTLTGTTLVVDTVVGSSPATIKTASGGTLRSPYWLDDNRIVYIFVNNTFLGPHTINVINKDGTGDTVLYTNTTTYGIPMYVSCSPSGSYITFSIRREQPEFVNPNELWMMNADGSSPTLIYTAPVVGSLQFETYMNWAWQHAADVIGFCEITAFGAPSTYRWRSMNYDGSNVQDLYTTEEWANTGASIHSWLADDSAMIGMKVVAGPPIYQLYTIAADGSGVTALSPARYSYTGSFGQYRATPCSITGRIYWVDTSFDTQLVSVKDDGSDYRVEQDMTATAVSWHGFLYFGQ